MTLNESEGFAAAPELGKAMSEMKEEMPEPGAGLPGYVDDPDIIAFVKAHPEWTHAEPEAIIEAFQRERGQKSKKQYFMPTGKLLTSEILISISTEHHNSAIALSMNRVFGGDAPDGGRLRYNVKSKLWHCWDGKRWIEREPSYILGIAWDHVRELMIEATDLRNTDAQKKIIRSQSDGELKSALELLATRVIVEPDDMDKDNYILNVQNGTLDLRTQTLRPFDKRDMNTKICTVKYDPTAPCPKWEAHLNLVFAENTELIKAFQVAKGYSLIGGQGENVVFFLYGSGKNGKSITEGVISKLLGDYAIAAAAKTFYQRQNEDGPRPDIARLKGCRYITASEGKASGRLDEGLIKQLSGGDPVTARYLFGREFDFYPTGKLWFHTNHLPKILDRDEGIWRRIYPFPFTAVIPEGDRIKDYDRVLLDEEGPGILNWLLEGVHLYLNDRKLRYPKEVLGAIEKYKSETDVLGEFLSSYTITKKETDIIGRSELYIQYKNWGEGDRHLFNKARFNRMIEDRVGPAKQVFGRGICWIGIKLASQTEL